MAVITTNKDVYNVHSNVPTPTHLVIYCGAINRRYTRTISSPVNSKNELQSTHQFVPYRSFRQIRRTRHDISSRVKMSPAGVSL